MFRRSLFVDILEPELGVFVGCDRNDEIGCNGLKRFDMIIFSLNPDVYYISECPMCVAMFARQQYCIEITRSDNGGGRCKDYSSWSC